MARYALVIGIAEYVSPSLPRLSKTINDAEAIAQLLEQYGDFQSVQRLLQTRKTTEAQIGQELRKLLLEKAKNNEALIYFSGHGFITSDTLGQQEGFLATSNCQVEVKGNQIVAQKYGISLNKLNKLIGESQLSSLVVLLDCCHSGYFLERELVEQTLTAFRSLKDYYLIAACRRFEKAAAIMSEEYSIFTGAVIKGLAAENADKSGRITSDRLLDFVSNRLIGSIQEPVRMSLGRPITLVSYPQLNILKEEIAFNKENPYQGLSAFESEQAQYFCGRDEAVRTLILRLAESRFLAIIGYSGSGKSSLVKAGVLPQLKSDRPPGSSKWKIISFTPGEHPYGKLVDILVRQQQQNQPHILFIDQFEEIFTLCQDDEERKAFIRLVAEEVKTTERQTRIILTIRGDFLKRCNDYLEIITLINSVPPTTFLVPPMSFAELEEAIAKPAKLHGVNFEHGLVSQITNDVVTRPGALPILQYALKELWRVCIEEPESPEPLLTRKGYEEIGAVKGALDKRATILYQNLPTTEHQAFARSLFMELVQLGEAGEVTRRRATWKKLEAIADSPQQLQRVVESLAGSQGRLIITDKDTVEVAHEALLSEWKLLNTWIAENLENIRLSRSLEEDCQEWVERFNQSDDALLAGAKLAVISEWFEKNKPRVTPQETDFLHKSLDKKNREKEAELRRERLLREAAEAKVNVETQKTKLSILAGILTAFSLGLGLLAQQQTAKVKQRETLATVVMVSKAKQLLESGNQLDALVASLQALQEVKNEEIGSQDSAFLQELQSIILKIHERNQFQGHTEGIWSVTFDKTGKFIASASGDGTVKLWTREGQLLETFSSDNSETLFSVKFSPDGTKIAAASYDGTIKLWTINGNTKQPDVLKNGHKKLVYDIAFDPNNGEYLASCSLDGTIILWDLKYKRKIDSHQEKWGITNMDFSSKQKLIAFAVPENENSSKWNIKTWNLNEKINKIKILANQKDSISSIKFNPTGEIIAYSSYKGTIKLVAVKNNLVSTIINTKHQNLLNTIAFSNDGKIIASGGQDGTIQLWEIKNISSKLKLLNDPLDIMKGFENEIQSISFNPQIKNELISGNTNAKLRVWEIISDKTENKEIPKLDNLIMYSCQIGSNYIEMYKQKNNELEEISNFCKNQTKPK